MQIGLIETTYNFTLMPDLRSGSAPGWQTPGLIFRLTLPGNKPKEGDKKDP